MILGCDAAGIDEDGNEVVLHSVIGQSGYGVGHREGRSILTEKYQGTFAEQVSVPTWNVLPKPKELSFAEAACLPTAWLTAYRMLFTNAGVRPGDSVLVQGAGGGVATAAIVLGKAAGLRVFATSRDEAKRKRALELGAVEAVESGAAAAAGGRRHRDGGGGDVVALHQVPEAGRHSGDLRRDERRPALACGADQGLLSGAEDRRFDDGIKDELEDLLSFCAATGVRPVIDEVLPLDRAREGFERIESGDVFGKVVLEV